MKERDENRAPELASLYELPEFADGMHALAAAAKPLPGLETRVLARLDMERGRSHPAQAGGVRAGAVRGWSLAIAATLLLCTFFGERAVNHRAIKATERASNHAASTPHVPGSAPASPVRTADAQRAPVIPVAVGGRVGRVGRSTHEQHARDAAARKPLGIR